MFSVYIEPCRREPLKRFQLLCGMAEPNQHLIPPPATIAKASEDISGDGQPLSDPNVLEYSSSPTHAETQKHSGPHPPPDPDNLQTHETVDFGGSLQSKSLQAMSIMNGMPVVTQTIAVVSCIVKCVVATFFWLLSHNLLHMCELMRTIVLDTHCIPY